MSKYILLFRPEGNDLPGMPPDMYRSIVAEFETWYWHLRDNGKFVTKGRLKDGDGHTLRMKEGEFTIDGPYSETKEALAGYFMIDVDDYDAAIKEAKGCPLLRYGASVEVREMRFTDEVICAI